MTKINEKFCGNCCWFSGEDHYGYGFCPLRWKSAFSPAKLHKLLKEDVVADKIHVEYIDFVKEEVEDKKDKIWKIDYD